METVQEILNNRVQDFNGDNCSEREVDYLIEALKLFESSQLLKMLFKYSLCGCNFSIEEDMSCDQMEIDFQWMNISQILSESMECYPGKVAVQFGYLPIGICSVGTGDYYYLKINNPVDNDPPLVRIFHDALDNNNELKIDCIEVVSNKLSAFLKLAEIT
jgi:hypothetical protein